MNEESRSDPEEIISEEGQSERQEPTEVQAQEISVTEEASKEAYAKWDNGETIDGVGIPYEKSRPVKSDGQRNVEYLLRCKGKADAEKNTGDSDRLRKFLDGLES